MGNTIHTSKKAAHEAAQFLAKQLRRELRAKHRVAWLLSGGSCIAVAVAAAKLLRTRGATLPWGNLAITLGDERYGEVGHTDSNWTQLLQAGFDLPGATLVPVLDGGTFDETGQRYAELIQVLLARADYRLGLFGMGADGHTAGMLPDTGGTMAAALAYQYQGDDYKRLSITQQAVAQLDQAVLYAEGEPKWPALAQLCAGDVPPEKQPASALRHAGQLNIFTDYKGEIT